VVWNQRELSAYWYPSGVPQTETAKVTQRQRRGGREKEGQRWKRKGKTSEVDASRDISSDPVKANVENMRLQE